MLVSGTDSGGAYLHFALFPARPPELPATSTAEIGFLVAEVEALHVSAVAAGVRVWQEATMRILRIAVVLALIYVGIVVAFESFIGVLQPADESTLVITTFEPDGSARDRVVSRLGSDGKLYVAANHWPRAWYERALENPDVQATIDGAKGDYRAVPVTGAEHDRVDGENSLPLVFRILTGFPPRYFLRLDPREAAGGSR